MLETFLNEKLETRKNYTNLDIVSLLEKRKVEYVSFADWKRLDAHETDVGQKQGRPRVKLTSLAEMLSVIRQENN